MHKRMMGAASMVAATFALAAPAGAGAARSFYGVTEGNRLVTFQSDSPGATRSSQPITGLLEDEEILGIDVRPSGGGLYGVGSTSRLYRIDGRTGRATAITRGLFDVFLRGTDIGFDVDPVADTMRVVSDGGQNLRVDPETGEVVDGNATAPGPQADRDLSYPSADSGAAAGAPHVAAVAYTANRPGATATQLFGIDSARDTLVLQNPPNEGTLATIGRLGVNATGPVSFDVAGDGRAYAAFRKSGRRDVGLYRIDLKSGRASRALRVNAVGTYLGGSRDPLRALAAAGTVAADRTPARVRVRKLNDPDLLAGETLRVSVHCSEACRVTSLLLLGRRVVARATGHVRGRAGRVALGLRLSPRQRRRLRAIRARRLLVGVRTVDAAGNVTRSHGPGR